jgi:RND family efflux transporter MFP subunit
LKAGARSEEIARAKETVRRIQAEIAQAQSDWDLSKTRVRRNQSLEAEGAIARDRLDEVVNEERNKQSIVLQAEARLREAKQQLKELEAGARPEAIAQAAAQLAEAKAQMQIALTRLSDSKLVSPVSGKVAERFARVGDVTSSSQKLFAIVENNRLELQLKIPETQLPSVRPGQAVKVYSETDRSLTLNGTVRAIVPTVDAASRQAIVKVSLPPAANLKPGMFLSAAIVTDSASSLAIPMEAALPQNNGLATVYRLRPDSTVERQSVKLGEVLPGDRVEIVEGLKVGDRVAVKGAAYLNDGDRVTVTN